MKKEIQDQIIKLVEALKNGDMTHEQYEEKVNELIRRAVLEAVPPFELTSPGMVQMSLPESNVTQQKIQIAADIAKNL